MSSQDLKMFHDIKQNSEEWLKIRCGIPTASAFSKILAKGEGKVRRTYLSPTARRAARPIG